MRRRLATVALLLLAIGALAAVAAAEVVQSGNVRITFHAKFTPAVAAARTPGTDLGRSRRADLDHRRQPAAAAAEAADRTDQLGADRRPRPARLHGVGAAVDQLRTGARSAAGRRRSATATSRRTCSSPANRSWSTAARSSSTASSAGGRGCSSTSTSREPVTVTLVIPLKISHGSGRFGTVLTTRVPKLAGGFGSITELQLQIGRRYSYRGARHSYLSAACAAPSGFPGATFTFARGRLQLRRRPYDERLPLPQLSSSGLGRIGVCGTRQRNRRGEQMNQIDLKLRRARRAPRRRRGDRGRRPPGRLRWRWQQHRRRRHVSEEISTTGNNAQKEAEKGVEDAERGIEETKEKGEEALEEAEENFENSKGKGKKNLEEAKEKAEEIARRSQGKGRRTPALSGAQS